MKLSFIVPYYNSEKTIARCLDSLLNQDMTEDEYEIIVVDDGSTEPLNVLNDYRARHSNIRYVYQQNARQGAARNHGVRVAKGDYVHFCDSDDRVQPQTFGRLVRLAEEWGG